MAASAGALHDSSQVHTLYSLPGPQLVVVHPAAHHPCLLGNSWALRGSLQAQLAACSLAHHACCQAEAQLQLVPHAARHHEARQVACLPAGLVALAAQSCLLGVVTRAVRHEACRHEVLLAA